MPAYPVNADTHYMLGCFRSPFYVHNLPLVGVCVKRIGTES